MCSHLSFVTYHSFIYIIYYVTLIMYEKIDKYMVKLSIITHAVLIAHYPTHFLSSGKNINNDIWSTPG